VCFEKVAFGPGRFLADEWIAWNNNRALVGTSSDGIHWSILGGTEMAEGLAGDSSVVSSTGRRNHGNGSAIVTSHRSGFLRPSDGLPRPHQIR